MSEESKAFVIGIDAGTTSIKGLLLSTDGQIVASAGEEYTLDTGPGDICEVDPEIYWEVTCRVIRRLVTESGKEPAAIRGLAFASQGETLIVVDSDGKPLRKAIVWLDNRSVAEAGMLEKHFGSQKIMDVTGQPEVQAIWPATRILWLKSHEADVFAQTHKFLLVEDFLMFKLTGNYFCEHSLVSSTLYFDINTKTWWDEMLAFLGITPAHLPEPLPSGSVTGNLTAKAAALTGLDPKTMVVTGAYDHPAGAIGAGNLRSGMVTLTIGASMAMCVTLGKPVTDISLKLPCQCHALPGMYFLLPYAQTAGMVLKWFRDEFGPAEKSTGPEQRTNAYDLLTKEAEGVPPGAEGLIMLPHFMGTGSPEFKTTVRGVFAGITLGTHRGHFVRSILEAVAATIERNLEVMKEKGANVSEITLLGGGAKSRLWAQIIADMTGLPVVTNTQEEQAALGAAMFAGTGIGMFRDINEASARCVSDVTRYEPDAVNYALYRKIYKRYLSLYSHLEGFWDIPPDEPKVPGP